MDVAMDPVFLGVLTLLFGFLATLTALGGESIKPGGHFWQLNRRGLASVVSLALALVTGILKEVAQANQEEQERVVLEGSISELQVKLSETEEKLAVSLDENSELSRELREKTNEITDILKNPPIQIDATIDENGLFSIVDRGRGTDNQYDVDLRLLLSVGWQSERADGSYLLFESPDILAPIYVIDRIQRDVVRFESSAHRVARIPLPKLSDHLQILERLASEMLSKDLEERDESLSLYYVMCIRIEAIDSFGGNYIFEDGVLVGSTWSGLARLFGRERFKESCSPSQVAEVARSRDPTSRTRVDGEMVYRIDLELSELVAKVYRDNLDMDRVFIRESFNIAE